MSVPVIFVNRCRNASNSARIKIIVKIVFVLFLFYTQIVPLLKNDLLTRIRSVGSLYDFILISTKNVIS